MLDYVEHIILPYVKKTRQELCLSSTYPALVLFDSFKGQCIFQKLDENSILYIIVPPNKTDKLQLLDPSVNKPAKDFVKERFQSWYAGIICKQLQDKIKEPVDLRLSIMKPLAAQWIIEMYSYFQSHPDIIGNGFHAAGICDSLV